MEDDMKKLRMAIVGLGARGGSMLHAFYSKQKDIEILYTFIIFCLVC